MRVLVTGGAGFVGSHLVDALVTIGHDVRVFDNLDPQTHGACAEVPPPYLHPEAVFVRGDVRDRGALGEALHGVDVIYHLAAQTGVGQSMYQIERYSAVNIQGAALLVDLLIDASYSVRKLILASSRAVYGEGAYRCGVDGIVYPPPRDIAVLEQASWEPRCPLCGGSIQPVPTSEDAPLQTGSVYALSKAVQESLCQMLARVYGLKVVILRYFNVYGPRQSLTNPYTGILSIFSSMIRNGSDPVIYEDGLESRDFVHVSDVVQASLLALEYDGTGAQVINVGSGQRLTVLEIAQTLICALQSSCNPIFSGRFRVGDIRHCVADLGRAREVLGYEPMVRFEDGVQDFVTWAQAEHARDLAEVARQELAARGLYR